MPLQKLIPPYLKPGDEVAVISPSFAVDREKVISAVSVLENWGFRVRTGRNVFAQNGPYAGTDEERLADLQEMTSDRNIKAVFFARGGYGMLKIIDRVDFSGLRSHPKWYVGFSDITVLHLWLNKVLNIVTLHGEMPLNYTNQAKTEATLRTLKAALSGDPEEISWRGDIDKPADAVGEVTGGNLSLIYSLIGTKGEPDTAGKILFIEDVGEYYYHLDRMMTSLKLAGKLDKLSALVVGGMNKMEETSVPWGRSHREIISGIVSEFSYPVFFGFPAGHIDDNRALYIGRKARIRLDGDNTVLNYL